MNGYREPLIRSSIFHPIKFAWRFVVLFLFVYVVLGMVTTYIPFLTFLNQFLFHTGAGDVVYMILVVYLTMRWVRSSVEKDEENSYYESTIPPEVKERNRKEMADLLNQHIRYKQMEKRAKEEAQARACQDWKNAQAYYYYDKSREAHYNGNSAAEEAYKREAEWWKRM